MVACTVVCKRCRTTSKALGVVAAAWRNGARCIYDGHTLRWFVKQGSLLMRCSNVRTAATVGRCSSGWTTAYDCSFGVFRFNLRKVLLVRDVGGATPPFRRSATTHVHDTVVLLCGIELLSAMPWAALFSEWSMFQRLTTEREGGYVGRQDALSLRSSRTKKFIRDNNSSCYMCTFFFLIPVVMCTFSDSSTFGFI